MKLKDITNSECDVRKYMKVDMRSEQMGELADYYDIDYDVVYEIVKLCGIYVKAEFNETEIVPVNIQKLLEERLNELE